MINRFHPVRARLRHTLTVLLTAALPALVLGCGGGSSDNGVASKSPTEILAASKAAAVSASSVHVSGKNSEGRLSATLDLEVSSAGGIAHVAIPQGTFELIRIGETLYMKGNGNFYRTLGVSVPAETWLKAPISSTRVGALVGFTKLSGEVSGLLGSTGRLSKGPVTTANGQKAVELRQTTLLYRGSLYVATTGKPYPVQIVKRGQIVGQITFSDWNKPVALTAPAKTIELK